MDEKRSGYSLKMSGSSGGSVHLPGRGFPRPLPVAALLDAALADNAVAEALIAKGNPTILNLEAAAEARGEARGEVKGEARSILKILDSRGVAIGPAQREEILRCSDIDRLDRWLLRAALASSVDELISES